MGANIAAVGLWEAPSVAWSVFEKEARALSPQPWYEFEHKGCSCEIIPNGNCSGSECFRWEHHRNKLLGLDNLVCCHKFRSFQMTVLVLFSRVRFV